MWATVTRGIRSRDTTLNRHTEGVGVCEIDFQSEEHGVEVLFSRPSTVDKAGAATQEENKDHIFMIANGGESSTMNIQNDNLQLNEVDGFDDEDLQIAGPREEMKQGQKRSRFNWLPKWRTGDRSGGKSTPIDCLISDKEITIGGNHSLTKTSSFRYASLADWTSEEPSLASTTTNSSPNSYVEADTASLDALKRDTFDNSMGGIWETDHQSSTIHAAQLVVEESNFSDAWQRNAEEPESGEEIVEFFDETSGIMLSPSGQEDIKDRAIPNVLVPRQVSFNAVASSGSVQNSSGQPVITEEQPMAEANEKASPSGHQYRNSNIRKSSSSMAEFSPCTIEEVTVPINAERSLSNEVLLMTEGGKSHEESFELVRSSVPECLPTDGEETSPPKKTPRVSHKPTRRNNTRTQNFKWFSMRYSASQKNKEYQEFPRNDEEDLNGPETDGGTNPSDKSSTSVSPTCSLPSENLSHHTKENKPHKDDNIFEVQFQHPFTRMFSGLTLEEGSILQDPSDQFAMDGNIECLIDGTKVKQVNRRRLLNNHEMHCKDFSTSDKSECSLEIISTSTLEDREIERLISWEIKEYLDDLECEDRERGS